MRNPVRVDIARDVLAPRAVHRPRQRLGGHPQPSGKLAQAQFRVQIGPPVGHQPLKLRQQGGVRLTVMRHHLVTFHRIGSQRTRYPQPAQSQQGSGRKHPDDHRLPRTKPRDLRRHDHPVAHPRKHQRRPDHPPDHQRPLPAGHLGARQNIAPRPQHPQHRAAIAKERRHHRLIHHPRREAHAKRGEQRHQRVPPVARQRQPPHRHPLQRQPRQGRNNRRRHRLYRAKPRHPVVLMQRDHHPLHRTSRKQRQHQPRRLASQRRLYQQERQHQCCKQSHR